MSKYPELIIDLKKLKSNIRQVKNKCMEEGVEIVGIIKGSSGFFEVAKAFDEEGVSYIGSSRVEQLEPLVGKVKAPLMMIRIPMLSEVSDVVRVTDISLNSEIEVLKALNEEAKKQDKVHKVILMKDLGDLREGFWSEDDIIEASLLVENDLSNLYLSGIGTNLGCYGAITPTEEKLNELVSVAEKIEDKIGRKLDIISGGATTSLPRIFEKNMPERINNLRVGEGILLAKDLKDLWGYDMSYMYQDVFKLRCEVIEVKNKPTHPVGEIFVDAFGNKPTYEDRGIRRRALLAIGKVDYAFTDDLILNEDGAFIVGSSSDHTIVDVEDAKRDIKVGDVLEFDLCYSTMVYITNSPNIKKVFID
ncbi:MAG: alanine racemase [Bacilli bacterium]